MKPGAPFDEPWQARAFAMAVRLHEAGRFTWPVWSGYLGRALRAAPERAYWESWLAALEAVAADRRLAGAADLDARERAWRDAHAAAAHERPARLRDQ